jgi:uncharacterized membrane protein
MNQTTTRRIALTGAMTALVFLATYFTRIPTPLPGGYFNLGDAVILITAIILGRRSGFAAGALGSFLADIAFGAFVFAPITLVVKGIEGYVAGAISNPRGKSHVTELKRIIAVVSGALIMVAGYFFAEAYILGYFNEGFGYAAAVTELPINLTQGGLSAVLGYAVSTILIRVNVRNIV